MGTMDVDWWHINANNAIPISIHSSNAMLLYVAENSDTIKLKPFDILVTSNVVN